MLIDLDLNVLLIALEQNESLQRQTEFPLGDYLKKICIPSVHIIYQCLFLYFNAASKGDNGLCSVFAKGRIRKGIRCKTCAKHTTQVKNMISILGCSRTGLTKITTGTGDRQGNCGNWATVGQQRRRGRHVCRQRRGQARA
ncbi:hypothetical protein AMECASPLE_022086 [Ameca splendens]|uniref:Uncharacterized protein n=1 Tax=Ameca splendens TaxID=208324 RepID=A0ABV0YR18_9TELE